MESYDKFYKKFSKYFKLMANTIPKLIIYPLSKLIWSVINLKLLKYVFKFDLA